MVRRSPLRSRAPETIVEARVMPNFTLVDDASRAPCGRGDGLFLGWDQPRLAAAHAQLLPGGGRREPGAEQFG